MEEEGNIIYTPENNKRGSITKIADTLNTNIFLVENH